jgi:hypothetical protein
MKPTFPVIVIPIAVFAGWLFVRARNSTSRVRRVCGFALACGVAGFVPALIGPTFADPKEKNLLAGAGALAILCGVAAIVFTTWAIRVRRYDKNAAWGYLVLAGLIGVADSFFGVSQFVMGLGVLAPTTGKPWTWHSDEYGFDVTIPSEKWEDKPTSNVLASFICRRPEIRAIIAAADPAETEEQYEAALAYGKTVKQGTPTSRTVERDGTNRHGNPCWMYYGDATSGDQPYAFGISITRVRGRAVLLFFEGHYKMLTEAGHAQESDAFRAQADEFLLSVK